MRGWSGRWLGCWRRHAALESQHRLCARSRRETSPPCASPGGGAPSRCAGCSSVHPGRSVWVPATLEYALIGPWRNRPEIASIEELVAVRHLEELLRAAVERCAEQGDELVLAVELDSRRSPARYERAGLEMLEEVITYELGIAREPWSGSGHIRPVRVDASDEAAIDLVTDIDQASFPWLWRNSRAEFDVYLQTPGVEVWLVEADGEPVAYFGVTLFPDWGHLDRIAVVAGAAGPRIRARDAGSGRRRHETAGRAARRAEHATHELAIAAALRAIRLPAHTRPRLPALRRLVPSGTRAGLLALDEQPRVRRSTARMKGKLRKHGQQFRQDLSADHLG